MRKATILILITLLVFALIACSGNSDSTESQTPAATEQATASPYIPTPVDEPEWTLAEGELKLEDADNIYAEGEDIMYFAIIGTTEEDVELLFRFDDATADMLKQQSADNQYYMTLNGENIGNVTLNDDCTIASLKGQHTYEEMTALATKIRGLG